MPLYYGAEKVGAGVLGVLIATIPVQAAALELILKYRRPTLVYLGGIGVAGLGAVILIVSRHEAVSAAFRFTEMRYPIAVLLSASSAAVCAICVKRASRRLDSFTLATWGIPVGLAAVAWALPACEFGRLATMSRGAWLAMAYLVIGATVVSGLLWVTAIALLSPSQVSLYLYVTLIGSTLVAWGLGGEDLRLGFWLAAACIMLGLYLVNRERFSAAEGDDAQGGTNSSNSRSSTAG